MKNTHTHMSMDVYVCMFAFSEQRHVIVCSRAYLLLAGAG